MGCPFVFCSLNHSTSLSKKSITSSVMSRFGLRGFTGALADVVPAECDADVPADDADATDVAGEWECVRPATGALIAWG